MRFCGGRRSEVHPLPRHGALFTNPSSAADRAQPPLGGHGRDHRDGDLRAREQQPAAANGVIVTQGGSVGGWTLYAKDGKLKYCCTGQINWVRIDLGDDDQDHLITAEDKFNLAMARQ
jgi:hypothetical protein